MQDVVKIEKLWWITRKYGEYSQKKLQHPQRNTSEACASLLTLFQSANAFNLPN